MRRIASTVVGICLIAISLPALAWSCEQTTLTLPGEAGPGDTVPFSVGGLEEGSTYVILIEGRAVRSGGFGSNSGQFQMPDLGSSSRTVTAVLDVTHPEDEATDRTRPIQYRVPQPAAAPQAPASQPGAQTQAPAAPGATAPQRTPATTPQAAPRQRAGATRPRVRTQTRSTRSATRASEGAAGLAAKASSFQRGAATRPGTRAAQPASRRNGARAIARHPATAGPAVGARRSAAGTDVPAALLVGIALILVVGMGGAAARVVRSRLTPPDTGEDRAAVPAWIPHEIAAEARARDLVMEAELQEMIAEERAKQVDEPAVPA